MSQFPSCSVLCTGVYHTEAVMPDSHSLVYNMEALSDNSDTLQAHKSNFIQFNYNYIKTVSIIA